MNVILALLVMGLSGIVAQVLLLRELLVTFYGNELSIGIILANWLISEAIGSFFLGKKIEKIKRKIEAFVLIQILFLISFPVAIYLTRILRAIIAVIPGEGIGLLPIFYSSFLIIVPVSLFHGALFTFGCKIYSQFFKEQISSIGKVYVYETLGSIAGGIFFTYFLITNFHSFQISLIISFINLAICVILLRNFWQEKLKIILAGVSIGLLIFCGYLIFGNGADKLHQFSINNQWKGQNIIHYQNSIYGNIAVVSESGQYTFFYDGIPVITAPVPDITFVEEFTHLSLLSHPLPEQILVLSGGAGGVINEILKYQTIKKVDYAELDPLLLKLIQNFQTHLTQAELNDRRVKIKYIDGRLFVKETSQKYDVILIGLSDPSNLQINRFFTKEFFILAKNILKKEGVIAITLPGSLTYLREELKNLNACILKTLEDVFPYICIIPGDFNIFLGSNSQSLSLINPDILIKRLGERKLKIRYLTPLHINYRLNKLHLEWFLNSIKEARVKENGDFHPLGVFYGIAYWNAMFSPNIQQFFRISQNINMCLISILILIFTTIFIFLRSKIQRFSRANVPIAITATGFAGMLFQLILIFTFQILYGYVFHQIGLLVTAFTGGIAIGGLLIIKFLERIKNDIKTFIKIEIAIIIFSILLPLIFLFFHQYIAHLLSFLLIQTIFLILSFVSGILIGMEFPMANKIYLKSYSSNLSKTAGLLYGCDLFGGWLGGILGGVIFLPVLGLVNTCIIIMLSKLSNLAILLTAKQN